ncbi:hypothetical protein QYF36_015839 [Acer negundo]|nr:hypothetical protein QYF36_015839 [Acer negundo]
MSQIQAAVKLVHGRVKSSQSKPYGDVQNPIVGLGSVQTDKGLGGWVQVGRWWWWLTVEVVGFGFGFGSGFGSGRVGWGLPRSEFLNFPRPDALILIADFLIKFLLHCCEEFSSLNGSNLFRMFLLSFLHRMFLLSFFHSSISLAIFRSWLWKFQECLILKVALLSLILLPALSLVVVESPPKILHEFGHGLEIWILLGVLYNEVISRLVTIVELFHC